MHYKLIVIGSGPAGQKASVTAASLGARVSVVDASAMFGGVCLRTGGVPSKALREAILYLTGFRQRTFYGEDYAVKHQISRDDLRFRVEEVVTREVAALRRRMNQHDVEFLPGMARFVDANTLEIQGEDGVKQASADLILIACGTRPAHDPTFPMDEQRVLDTDSFLSRAVEGVARRFIVVGAGSIGWSTRPWRPRCARPPR